MCVVVYSRIWREGGGGREGEGGREEQQDTADFASL